MQSITTKYHGPTNFRGSRISANASGGRKLTVSYDYSLNVEGNHQAAAAALMAKLEWTGTIIGGETDPGMVWVFDTGPKIER